MAVVKNLMIRIGADFSAAKKGMQEATGELTRFKRDTERTTSVISGKRGLGGIGAEFKKASSSVSSSLSQIRGSKGLGGVAAGMLALRPAAGVASAGLRGLGMAAAGASRALGPVGLGIAVVTAALGVATVALYKASQPAVKFEADLGRLNMQLKGGAKDFMTWARAQGLAKTTSAELGSTFSVLLSSFISDNKQLAASTKDIVQATRVVASATGRPIEDALERMRSGLLGNTEAVEDLGIFVNVAMIESTKAFKQFAGSKSWDQLDFRVQQQIRLAAILEQTYARYGNTLQNNTMTKQDRLLEQLKDIKLNLSQAFLPIWDSVLPALIALTSKVATITETIARFFYRLKGWDYDALTKGTDQQTGAVEGQQGAYDDLAKSAKSARKELAAFDQLNLIGESGSGGSSGGSGSGSSGGGSNSGSTGGTGGGVYLPNIPPALNQKWRIEFDTPNPPDAGAGAVATAVTSTINSLIADTKGKLAGMWGELGRIAVGGVGPVKVATEQVAMDWRTMLKTMNGDLLVYQPSIEYEWGKLKTSTESLKQPLETTKTNWHETLDYMQGQLNAYRPYLEWGWYLTGQAVTGVQPVLDGTKSAWSETLSDMNTTLATNSISMVSSINNVSAAWESMRRTVGAPIATPQPVVVPQVTPQQPSWEMTPDVGVPTSSLSGARDSLSSRIMDALPYAAEQTLTMLQEAGPMMVGGGLLARGASAVPGAIKSLTELLKGLGRSLPAFASGGLVYGPTLAMVGDNSGASTDPEVISPLSKLEEAMGGSGSDEEVGLLRAILQAVKENRTVQAVIGQDAVGRAATNYINGETRRGNTPLLGL